ncbi:threonine aldolase family protein [Rhodohalobacter mucosus]|uniref:Low specificity L-threonine aldolase n=1 Tax=Rhodohalobacter mucosus TaxID=2079485 RepID=A0A316TS29_9BACT|nr:GntG family PLP-dependent aldolase [Rhodohalobacter mucosus]PWN07190.1 low specificity L-threonine aldolase [Rhodohalobacter mucosus]
MIDLRSDTVTKPTPGMLNAIMEAEVGDDVFSEDPTVNSFEQKMAGMFGMEAGLFVPSGTMSNQLSIAVLTRPGDEVIIDELGHVFNYESGAAAHLSSVQLRPLKGKNGKLSRQLAEEAIRPKNDWDPHTRVIAIENTTNKGGGVCYSREEMLELSNLADEQGIFLHLDGARIWNAIIKTDIEPEFFGSIADTISICFSKGLGAPVGSMMLSSADHIAKARRFRKMWGGGMRQVGLLAAAADYAVEHHFPLLEEDHRRARLFAEAVDENPSFQIDLSSVETNIVIFDVKSAMAEDVLTEFSDAGVGIIPFGPKTIRATFHFQVGDAELEKVIEVVRGYGN